MLRVRLARTPGTGAGTVSLAVADAAGEPVAHIEALTLARFDAAALAAHAHALPALPGGLVQPRVALPVAGGRTATAPALREHLRALAPHEREQAMLELVRTLTAQVLGIASPSLLEPHRPLSEIGLDSLMALQLRNRLGAAVGLRLSAALLFEYPTIHKTTFELLHQLRLDSQPDPAQQPFATSATPDLGDAAPDVDGEASLASQVIQLFQLPEVDLAMELLAISARVRRVRETRTRSKSHAPSPRPLQLAHSTAPLPPLLCLTPTPPISTLVTYATFASSLSGRRSVWGLTRPGYGPNDSLPSNLAELLALHIEHVKEIAAGGPFVLLGLSSGGWIAHALTSHLESIGLRPTALVLIDTYPPDELTAGLLSVFMSWLPRLPLPRIDNEFSAFGSYFFDLFAHWTPAPIITPTLFLRCTEPVPGIEHEQVPGRGGWQTSWKDAHTIIDVPYHHYNVMMEHAGSTAQIIHDWLAALPAGDPLTRVGQVVRAPARAQHRDPA